MNEVIKQLRINKGLTQQQLAKKTGLQQSTISRIEHNCANTSWCKIVKILIALKLDPKDFTVRILQYNTRYLNEFLSILVDNPHFKKELLTSPTRTAKRILQFYK